MMKKTTLTLICLLCTPLIFAKDNQPISKEIYKCHDGQSICVLCNGEKSIPADVCVQYKVNNYNKSLFVSGDELATVFQGTPHDFYLYLAKCISFYKIKEPISIDTKIEGQPVSFSNLSGKRLTLWQDNSSRFWIANLKDLKGALKAFVKWADRNHIKY